MTDDTTPMLDVSRLRADLAEAQAALAAFADGPAREAADSLQASFGRAGERIARSLARAAVDGETSMKSLAKTILEELAKVALARLLPNLETGGLPFFGARAVGGHVAPGGAYLVGERGPELFAPAHSGVVAPVSAAPVSITFNIAPGADADGFLRHRGQIAADVARALAYGRRNL